jgi:catechol 2,3-dioxygenase-like lactoylglutathione lyase family enzyme
MAKSASPIPKGYHSITSALTCRDAAKAIDFYKKAFGAEEVMRSNSPDGKVSHAELKIGDSIIFVNDEFPGMNLFSFDLGHSRLWRFPLHARCRRGFRSCRGGRSARGDADGRYVLGRSLRQDNRSVRASVEPRNARRGSNAGRDGQARRGVLLEVCGAKVLATIASTALCQPDNS